jgi:hypothetical protein
MPGFHFLIRIRIFAFRSGRIRIRELHFKMSKNTTYIWLLSPYIITHHCVMMRNGYRLKLEPSYYRKTNKPWIIFLKSILIVKIQIRHIASKENQIFHVLREKPGSLLVRNLPRTYARFPRWLEGPRGTCERRPQAEGSDRSWQTTS